MHFWILLVLGLQRKKRVFSSRKENHYDSSIFTGRFLWLSVETTCILSLAPKWDFACLMKVAEDDLRKALFWLTRDQKLAGVNMPNMSSLFCDIIIFSLSFFVWSCMRHCWTIKDDVRDSIFAGLLSILSNIQFVTYRTARSVRPLWTSYIRNGRGAWRFGHPMVGLMVPWPRLYRNNEQLLESFELLGLPAFLENPKFFEVQWYILYSNWYR